MTIVQTKKKKRNPAYGRTRWICGAIIPSTLYYCVNVSNHKKDDHKWDVRCRQAQRSYYRPKRGQTVAKRIQKNTIHANRYIALMKVANVRVYNKIMSSIA